MHENTQAHLEIELFEHFKSPTRFESILFYEHARKFLGGHFGDRWRRTTFIYDKYQNLYLLNVDNFGNSLKMQKSLSAVGLTFDEQLGTSRNTGDNSTNPFHVIFCNLLHVCRL